MNRRAESDKQLSALLAEVQREMDSRIGLNLNPIQPKFPAERVRQIAQAVFDEGTRPAGFSPSYLTKGVRHSILNTDERKFLDRILADKDMTTKYRQILMDRFSSGTELGQKTLVKLVPDNSVSNAKNVR